MHSYLLKQKSLMECIKDGNVKEFARVIRTLSCQQVYQLVFMVDPFGYSLVHQCAFFGQLSILKDLITLFRHSCRFLLCQVQQTSIESIEA